MESVLANSRAPRKPGVTKPAVKDGRDKLIDPLAVVFDPEISKHIRRALVDNLAHGDADVEQAVEKELGDRNIVSDFSKAMRPLGLDAGNLADIMAAYYVVMWTIIRRAPFPGKQQSKAIRHQLRQQLLGNPLVYDANRRQMMGEGMIYEAQIALETYRKAVDDDDELQLRRLAKNGRKNMIGRGIDLKQMNIARSGFRPR